MKQATRALLLGKLLSEEVLFIGYNFTHSKHTDKNGRPLISTGNLTLNFKLSWEECQLIMAEFGTVTSQDLGYSTRVEANNDV